MFRSQHRRFLPLCGLFVGLCACSQSGAGVPPGAQSLSRIAPADNTSILKNLNTDVVIGSTVDPVNGDKGPHSLAIVPTNYGLKKGQLVVCNFADSNGMPGNGTTVEVLNPSPGSNPTRFAQSNDIKGCAGTAINKGNQVYATGLISGVMTQFDQTGTEVTTYGSPLVAPFSAVDAHGKHPYSPDYVFASDASTGSIVSLGTNNYGAGYQQVATGFSVGSGSQTGWNTVGPSGLSYYQKTDTLYIADGASNTVDLFTHASALLVKNEIVVSDGGKKFTCLHKKTTCGKLVYAGSQLNAPVAMTVLPNGNLIVANTGAASGGGNELVEMTPKGVVLDTKVIDSGPAPAVFALATIGTSDPSTRVFYTDTNDNSVHELEP